MGEQLRQQGSVKWFNATKGFGFITPEGGGEDLFVHQTNISTEGFRSLREGEAVEFEIEAGPDGRSKAVNVTGPEGNAPEGAPRTFRAGGRGRGGRAGARGARGAGGGGGYGPAAYGYPQMPPMYAGFYYFPPDPTGRGVPGRGRGRGMPMQGGMPMQQGGMGYPGMGMANMAVAGGAGMGMPGEGSGEPSGLQVVVHNLPWTCQWQQLKDHFKEWRVERADVVYDAWGRSRGFGTVRLTNNEDAQTACDKLNNSQIDGRTISVRIDRFA